MGLNTEYINFFNKHIENLFQDKKVSMLELGDQVIEQKKINKHLNALTGKEYYTRKGYRHTSIDLNGLNQSEIKDLSNESDFACYHNTFDVITNSGTTEHVEPFDAQYICFKIIHDCLKEGGLMLHINPDTESRDNEGLWKTHCYFYYSEKFYEMLAKQCNYTILENTVMNGLRAVAMIKNSLGDFNISKEKLLENIDQRNLDLIITHKDT